LDAAYRSVRDQEILAAYAKLAGPALQAAGGRFLARALPARVYESGLDQRIVLIEFDSVAQRSPRMTVLRISRHFAYSGTQLIVTCVLSKASK